MAVGAGAGTAARDGTAASAGTAAGARHRSGRPRGAGPEGAGSRPAGGRDPPGSQGRSRYSGDQDGTWWTGRNQISRGRRPVRSRSPVRS
ncbi:hypothetical protein ACFFX0_08100 [Citricoccus parietis]|uniref:Uncharacterized protein n=1 Tax=Citricoccus parietis TaxID=592307 RepID=A0ABV5FWV6_9MICC